MDIFNDHCLASPTRDTDMKFRSAQPNIYHRRHGLTGDTKRRVFDTLFQLQQGKCAICGISQEGLDAKYPRHAPVYRKFVIDHCHLTGKIRGLLCAPCNILLGAYSYEPHWYPHLEGWLERNRDAILLYMQEDNWSPQEGVPV